MVLAAFPLTQCVFDAGDWDGDGPALFATPEETEAFHSSDDLTSAEAALAQLEQPASGFSSKSKQARRAISGHIARKAKTMHASCANSRLPTHATRSEAVFQLEKTIAHLESRLEAMAPEHPARARIEANLGKLAELRSQKLQYQRPSKHGHWPFHSHAPDDALAPGGIAVLQRESPEHYVRVLDGATESLSGEFAFVVPFDAPEAVLIGESHHRLAQGKPVAYAGTCWFDEDSRLIQWQNLTGHYKTHPGLNNQTAEARDAYGDLLPLGKFRAWHIGQLRAQELEKAYQANNRSAEATADALNVSVEELRSTLYWLGVA